MSLIQSLAITALLASVSQTDRSPSPVDMADVRSQYQLAIKTCNERFETRRLKVISQYSRDLSVLATKHQRSGDLDGLLAIRAEADRALKMKTLDASNVVTRPPALAEMQTAALTTLGAIPAERAKSLLQLWKRYDATLESEEKSLTRQGDLEGALQLRKERESERNSEALTSARRLLAASGTDKLRPPPAPPATHPAAQRQLVLEGFTEMVATPMRGPYSTYRGNRVESYWVGTRQGHSLRWFTAQVPGKTGPRDVAFVWAGANGAGDGTFQLLLNGSKILTFNSAQPESRVWREEGCSLFFESHRTSSDNLGIYTLSLPASDLIPGERQELEVRPAGGFTGDLSWIMVHHFTNMTDTASSD